MERRRRDLPTINPVTFGVKPKKTKTNKGTKSNYASQVENSVKKLVKNGVKDYNKGREINSDNTGKVSKIQINGGGKKYTFKDVTEPVDIQLTEKTALRFKIVKSEEESIYRVDIRTMVLKKDNWIYTERGVNFEIGYIEDVIMTLVGLASEDVDEAHAYV